MKHFLIVGLTICAVSLALARERLCLDPGWRFHLGDAPDAGDKFSYPEAKDLSKTHIEEVGATDKLTAGLPDPATVNLGGDVSFVQSRFDDKKWRELDLPHDWAVELPFLVATPPALFARSWPLKKFHRRQPSTTNRTRHFFARAAG